MRLSSANAVAGLVLASHSVAITANTFPRAESGPGYLAVPVGTIPRTHQSGKRAANSVETTLFNLNFFYAAQRKLIPGRLVLETVSGFSPAVVSTINRAL